MKPERGLLIDPRMVFPSRAAAVIGAFYSLEALLRQDPLSEPIRCIDPELLNEAYKQPRSAAKDAMIRMMARFVRYEPIGPERATIASMPSIAGDVWQAALHEATALDETASWRTPTILVPSAHAAEWPAPGEVGVSGLAGPASRRLVRVEDTPDDPEFWHDIDPWLFKCRARHRLVDEDEPDSPMTEHLHCLPRPPETRGCQAWDEIERCLERRRQGANWYKAGSLPQAYFIPAVGWQVSIETRDSWRGRNIFERGSKSTKKGTLNGVYDSGGRVWAWAKNGERHWDVQHEDEKRTETYWNVLPDGRVQKWVDEGAVTLYPLS